MKKSFGFTFVEIGIVLLITAAIIYGVLRLITNIQLEAKVTGEVNEIAQFITATQKAKQLGSSFTQINDYANSKVYPKHWTISGINFITPFGTAGTSFPPQLWVPSLNENHLNINLSNPSPKLCILLATALAQNKNVGSIWAGSTVGNDQVKSDFGQLNYNTVTSNCNTPVRVAFNFSLVAR